MNKIGYVYSLDNETYNNQFFTYLSDCKIVAKYYALDFGDLEKFYVYKVKITDITKRIHIGSLLESMSDSVGLNPEQDEKVEEGLSNLSREDIEELKKLIANWFNSKRIFDDCYEILGEYEFYLDDIS